MGREKGVIASITQISTLAIVSSASRCRCNGERSSETNTQPRLKRTVAPKNSIGALRNMTSTTELKSAGIMIGAFLNGFSQNRADDSARIALRRGGLRAA